MSPSGLPRPLPDVLCALCELPYRHHDDFERCLFSAAEVYFREMTPPEWHAYTMRRLGEGGRLFTKIGDTLLPWDGKAPVL